MLDESNYQFILTGIILGLFIHASWIALRGFRSSTSWFCMLFSALTTSQYIFIFPAAFAGNTRHEWLIGRLESTFYLELVITSLLSLWAGHLLIKKRATLLVGLLKVPPLRLNEHSIDRLATIASFGGAIVAIISAILGWQGYFMKREYLENPPFGRTVLSFVLNISILLTFVTNLSAYRQHKSLQTKHFFLMAIWIIAGFLSAFKTQVILPMILLSIAAWISKRLSFWHYVGLSSLIIISYSVVEPMRDIAHKSNVEISADVAFLEVIDDNLIVNVGDSVIDEFINRLDYSNVAIKTLSADRYGGLQNYKQSLREQYRLLPLLTFIPGFLWSEKPLQDLGKQLSIDLDGNPFNSVTPSQPVASYLAGGYLLVILSGLVLGVIITIAGSFLLIYRDNPMQYIPMILLAMAVSIGDTYFSSYLIGLVRILFMGYFLYFVMRIFKVTINVNHTTKKKSNRFITK